MFTVLTVIYHLDLHSRKGEWVENSFGRKGEMFT